MSEEQKNYEPVDLSGRRNRLLKNVCRCGVTLGLGLIMAKAAEKAVEYGGDTLKGFRTETTQGRADNGHWVEFVSPKVDQPLKTLGDALKTVGAAGIAGLAGWGLIPKRRRETMSEDAKALYMVAKREFSQE